MYLVDHLCVDKLSCRHELKLGISITLLRIVLFATWFLPCLLSIYMLLFKSNSCFRNGSYSTHFFRFNVHLEMITQQVFWIRSHASRMCFTISSGINEDKKRKTSLTRLTQQEMKAGIRTYLLHLAVPSLYHFACQEMDSNQLPFIIG